MARAWPTLHQAEARRIGGNALYLIIGIVCVSDKAKKRVGGCWLKIRIRRGRDCSSEQEGKGIQSVLSAASAGTEETTAGRLLPLSVTLI